MLLIFNSVQIDFDPVYIRFHSICFVIICIHGAGRERTYSRHFLDVFMVSKSIKMA